MRIVVPSSTSRIDDYEHHLPARNVSHFDNDINPQRNRCGGSESTGFNQRFKSSKRQNLPDHFIPKSILWSPRQQLNAARDFNSPARSSKSLVGISSLEYQKDLVRSHTKEPEPLTVEQINTADRLRISAMRLNSEERQGDFRQADRFLENSTKNGEDEGIRNYMFCSTSARTNQVPLEYSTRRIPMNLASSRSNFLVESRLKDCCLKSSRKMNPIKLKPQSLKTIDDDAVSGKVNWNTSQVLASMVKAIEGLVKIGGLLPKIEDESEIPHCKYGRNEHLCGRVSITGRLIAQLIAFIGSNIPEWRVVVSATCLVVGLSGFSVGKIVHLVEFVSRQPFLTLTRGEQKRMRDRARALHDEVEKLYLFTLAMEMKSQSVVLDFHRDIQRIQIDRQKHQDIVTNEMQKFRQRTFGVLQELVIKHRDTIKTQLLELSKKHKVVTHKHTKHAGDNTSNESCKEIHKAASRNICAEKPTTEHPGEFEIYLKRDDGPVRPLPIVELSNQQILALAQQNDVTLQSLKQSFDSSYTVPNEIKQKFADALSHSNCIKYAEDMGPGSICLAYVTTDMVHHKVDLVASLTDDQGESEFDKSFTSVTHADPVLSSLQIASKATWNEILLLVVITIIIASVVVRTYNIYHRNKYSGRHRKRKHQRALRRAHQRARAIIECNEYSDECDGKVTDLGIEEVFLMSPEEG
ncbi:hypothetical protein CCR75_009198 [Bremia lactucae]|uniref:Uncharacterized protein n=1 Tax=Bremia lactucae TaxID=4779 RepID=A0A976FFP0_BRELC|nr:hypothetical protein CCR75_009198 [Bremia lactucae]